MASKSKSAPVSMTRARSWAVLKSRGPELEVLGRGLVNQSGMRFRVRPRVTVWVNSWRTVRIQS